MIVLCGQKLVTGLVVAWALFTAFWLLAAGLIGGYIAQSKTPRLFEYVYVLRDGVKVAWREQARPLYDLIRSPAAEKLPVAFAQLGRGVPDLRSHEGRPEIFEYPDDTKLYLSPVLSDTDRTYIKTAYEGQRRARLLAWLKVKGGWLAVVLLPPLFLFAVIWIGSYFRFADTNEAPPPPPATPPPLERDEPRRAR